jgi:hypothetical protein
MEKLKAFFAGLWAKVRPTVEAELDELEPLVEAKAEQFVEKEAHQLDHKLGLIDPHARPKGS